MAYSKLEHDDGSPSPKPIREPASTGMTIRRTMVPEPITSAWETNLMTREEIAREIIDLLDEDCFGLWEIGWRLTGTLGMSSTEIQSEVAEVTYSLVRSGAVEAYTVDQPGGSMKPLMALDQAIDLRERAAWDVPAPGNPQIWLALPADGEG